MKDFESRRKHLDRCFWRMRDRLLQGYSPNPGIDKTRAAKLGTQTKSSFKDLVTIHDKAVEEEIFSLLQRDFPGEFILGEEGTSASKVKAQERLSGQDSFWTIDPIDGTTNFSRSYPFFCTTLAFVEKNSSGLWESRVALTFDAVHGEMFTAAHKAGAYLNGEKTSVTDISLLEQALLTTGFASERTQHSEKSFETFRKLTRETLGVRRDGAAALDLAYVACGRIDAYWESGLSIWDIASGVLLIQEAGGKCSRFDGSDILLFEGQILSSNSKIHELIKERIL